MHGLLASQSCYHSVLPLVCVHCGPVVDFFITKQTSLHPFDFVRNLFHLLYIYECTVDADDQDNEIIDDSVVQPYTVSFHHDMHVCRSTLIGTSMQMQAHFQLMYCSQNSLEIMMIVTQQTFLLHAQGDNYGSSRSLN